MAKDRKDKDTHVPDETQYKPLERKSDDTSTEKTVSEETSADAGIKFGEIKSTFEATYTSKTEGAYKVRGEKIASIAGPEKLEQRAGAEAVSADTLPEDVLEAVEAESYSETERAPERRDLFNVNVSSLEYIFKKSFKPLLYVTATAAVVAGVYFGAKILDPYPVKTPRPVGDSIEQFIEKKIQGKTKDGAVIERSYLGIIQENNDESYFSQYNGEWVNLSEEEAKRDAVLREERDKEKKNIERLYDQRTRGIHHGYDQRMHEIEQEARKAWGWIAEPRAEKKSDIGPDYLELLRGGEQ
jgi:hypothetical protein